MAVVKAYTQSLKLVLIYPEWIVNKRIVRCEKCGFIVLIYPEWIVNIFMILLCKITFEF